MLIARYRRWWACAALVALVALLALLPHTIQAQDASPVPTGADLVVSLRDDQDVPRAGATIIVRNANIDGEIGRVPTAADGTATIPLPAGVQTIRVEVVGQMPAGTPFTHQTSDIGGILFFPGTLGETRLDLVVTAEGLVLPDPRMWVLDPIPATEATMPSVDPTLPVASPPGGGTGPAPTIRAPTPTRWIPATPLVGHAPTVPAESAGMGLGGFLLVLVAALLMFGGVWLLVVRRGR